MAAELSIKAKMKTVMVVDDDPAMTALLRYILGKLGYSTIVAGDGHQALLMAAATLPDCILLDLAMPNLDGYGFLVAQGNSSNLRGIPTIVLSSKNRSDEVQRAIQLGAVGYVTKPVDPKKLGARLEKFVPSPFSAPAKTSVSWLN